MKSLRLRLVLLTTAAVAVVWLLTAIFTWRSALHEIEELLNHPPTSVSHMQEERAELAGEIAEHLLMPMLVALPGLALVLVVAVGFSLRPLRRLTDDLATRAPNRLTPIASTDTPREIAPLSGASTNSSPVSTAPCKTSAASPPTPRTSCARRWRR